MKRTEAIIKSTMTDLDVLRAKRKVAKLNNERKDGLTNSERRQLVLDKELNSRRKRHTERQFIDEALQEMEDLATPIRWNTDVLDVLVS
jgi:hypothetical protein